MNNDKLVIFDTTLRDGEQSPGASMTKDEKMRIAKALERMRVDVIEAGFPIASQGDFESVEFSKFRVGGHVHHGAQATVAYQRPTAPFVGVFYAPLFYGTVQGLARIQWVAAPL